MDNYSLQDVNRYVSKSGSDVVLSVLKYSVVSPGGVSGGGLVSSSSASSGHNLTESSPDALSASPRSPHSRLWDNTSPESNKVSLKSSGSQTDSLDSPTPSARSPARGGAGEKPQESRYMNVFRKPPFLSTLERDTGSGMGAGPDRDREDGGRMHSSAGMVSRGKGGAVGMSPSSHDSPPPPPLPAHPPPPYTSSHRTMEEEVIDDLNAIIHHYTKNPTPGALSAGKVKRTRDKDENAGTWPKCRGPLDYPGGPQAFPPAIVKTKEHPPLSVIAADHAYVMSTSPSAGGSGKVAPTPPERSDSFNRSKTITSSIKHSPQNSAEAAAAAAAYQSTQNASVNAASRHLMTSDVGMTSHHIATHTPSSHAHAYLMTSSPGVTNAIAGAKSNAYVPSPKPLPSSPVQSLDKDSGKSGSVDSKVSSGLYYGSTTSSSQQTSSSSSTVAPSQDHTVESANNDEILQSYYKRRKQQQQPHRPNSAPGLRSRDKQKELAAQLHGSGGRTVPPTSLDIQPIYSPRPLPHTKRNITPATHDAGAVSPLSGAHSHNIG